MCFPSKTEHHQPVSTFIINQYLPYTSTIFYHYQYQPLEVEVFGLPFEVLSMAKVNVQTYEDGAVILSAGPKEPSWF